MNITNQQYLTIVRQILSMAGGALITSGAASDSTVQAVIGVAMPLAAMAWGWFVHAPEQVVAQAQVIKQKGMI
jgi:hypothetical protein